MRILQGDEIYEKYVRPLSKPERLKLLERTARDLARGEEETESHHSILELRGLGKEIWAGVDSQRYVNELREEWDR